VSLVIDSSVTLAWFFKDERTPATQQMLAQVVSSGAIAPSLWRLEVANALQMAVRRSRIDAAFRDAAITQLQALMINIDTETDTHAWTDTLHLAERHKLTLYDSAYLELALRLGLPLATLDRELRTAGNALGIAMRGV